MPTNLPRLRRIVGELLVPGVIVGLTCIVMLAECSEQFVDRDVAVYAVIAHHWGEHGLVPYRDLVDHKPPLIFVFFRLCFAFFGQSPWALWQGTALLTAGSSLMLYAGFRALGRPIAGGLAAIGFLVVLYPNLLDLRSANTEHLATFFACGALAVMLGYWRAPAAWLAAAAGVMVGLAALSKPPALLFGGALAIMIALQPIGPSRLGYARRVATHVALLTAGVGLVIAGCLAWFAGHAALVDFYTWVWERNVNGYVTAGQNPWRQRERLWRIMTNELHGMRRTAGTIYWPLALGVAVTAIAAVVRRSRLDLAALLLLSAGTAAVLCGSLFFRHYLVFLHMPIAVCMGVAGDFLLAAERPSTRPRWRALAAGGLTVALFGYPLVCLLAMTPAASARLAELPNLMPTTYRQSVGYRLAQQINAISRPGDRVWSAGDATFEVIRYLTPAQPASRFFYLPHEISQNEHIVEYASALRRLPKLVVIQGSPDAVDQQLNSLLDDGNARDRPSLAVAGIITAHYVLWRHDVTDDLRVYLRVGEP